MQNIQIDFFFIGFFKSFSFLGFTDFTIFLYYVFKVLLSLLLWNLGDMFLVWKVTWNFDKNIYLSTLQKFEEPMLTQMYDSTNGDDDKMIHLLLKNKLQVPTSFNVVICNWKLLLATIQYCKIYITINYKSNFKFR
jgi:hypothetical protein